MTDLTPPPPAHLEGSSSWLSKLTSAKFLGHPLVWSAMTALFILGGYFWLQNYALPLSEKIRAKNAQSERIGTIAGNNWNPDSYQAVESKEVMSITRKADTLRAHDYRSIIELENQINPLLSQARDQMERQQYTSEDKPNAWLSYQQILDLDATHSLANSGQEQILSILQSNAEDAVQDSQYETAERWLTQLDAIKPNHPFQTELRQSISNQMSAELAESEAALRETERLQRLKSALDDANSAINLSPPKLRSAYDLFSRALEIDEGNKAALSGLRQIHLKRIDIAKTAIAKGLYLDAEAQITRLQETQADSDPITSLQQSIATAKARDLENLQKVAEENTAPSETDSASNEQNAEVLIDTPSEPNESPDSIDRLIPDSAISPGEVATTSIEVNTKPVPALNISDQVAPTITPAQSNQFEQLNEGINAYYAGDYNSAFEKLHPLAEDDIARAQFRLGIMYYQGRTVVKNVDLANQWVVRALPTVLRASQNGEAWAQADLGTAYELGIGLNKDVERSAALYQQAAEQGYAGAQTNLGVLYGTGDGVKYDRQLAVYWLKLAAAQGDKIAQDNLDILKAR